MSIRGSHSNAFLVLSRGYLPLAPLSAGSSPDCPFWSAISIRAYLIQGIDYEGREDGESPEILLVISVLPRLRIKIPSPFFRVPYNVMAWK